MNGIALFDALTKIDDPIIDRAYVAPVPFPKTTRARLAHNRWAIAAECACFVAVVGGALFLYRAGMTGGGPSTVDEPNKGGVPSSSDVAVVTPSTDVAVVTPSTEPAATACLPATGYLSDPGVSAADSNAWIVVGTEAETMAPVTGTPNDYDLSVKDGRNYLNFRTENENPVEPSYNCLNFVSVDAMLRAIRSNSFQSWQYDVIRSFPSDENGIRIIDPDRVYDAVAPEGWEVSSVLWYGANYSFDLVEPSGGFASLTVVSPEEYEAIRANENSLLYGGTEINVTGRENVADRNAEIVRYDTPTENGLYDVRYALQNGVTVVEQYAGGNDAVPDRIFLFGDEGTRCFYAIVYRDSGHPTERPSEEWLSQFGVRERTKE